MANLSVGKCYQLKQNYEVYFRRPGTVPMESKMLNAYSFLGTLVEIESNDETNDMSYKFIYPVPIIDPDQDIPELSPGETLEENAYNHPLSYFEYFIFIQNTDNINKLVMPTNCSNTNQKLDVMMIANKSNKPQLPAEMWNLINSYNQGGKRRTTKRRRASRRTTKRRRATKRRRTSKRRRANKY